MRFIYGQKQLVFRLNNFTFYASAFSTPCWKTCSYFIDIQLDFRSRIAFQNTDSNLKRPKYCGLCLQVWLYNYDSMRFTNHSHAHKTIDD